MTPDITLDSLRTLLVELENSTGLVEDYSNLVVNVVRQTLQDFSYVPRIRYVVGLHLTCAGCPYQWAAYEPDTGMKFYARSRNNCFYATFSDPGGCQRVAEEDREVTDTWEMMKLAKIELVMIP